jgi:hypothetical protein
MAQTLGEISRRPYAPGPDREPYEVYTPDDGCRVAPSCLACPRETCIYDAADGTVPPDSVHRQRADAVERLVDQDQGLPRDQAITQVSREMGVWPRTIWRSMRKLREGVYG